MGALAWAGFRRCRRSRRGCWATFRLFMALHTSRESPGDPGFGPQAAHVAEVSVGFRRLALNAMLTAGQGLMSNRELGPRGEGAELESGGKS